MTPKPGTPVTLVAPATPLAALEAGAAVAGIVEAALAATAAASQTSSASAGGSDSDSSSATDTTTSTTTDVAADSPPPADPPTNPHQPDPAKKGWIEILLKDEEGTPQGGARYRVTLPDNTASEGTLDAKGHARVDGFDSGQCKVTFPDLDEKTWKEK